MRRSIFLAAAVLSVAACGSSSEQPSASSQSTISGSTTGTEAVAVTNADAALDTSAAVATLRAIATAAAAVGRDGVTTSVFRATARSVSTAKNGPLKLPAPCSASARVATA